MPKFIFLKSLIRKPVKSILIFGIIFLMTFLFIARAAEYCGLYFGTKELSDYYRPIGSLNYSDGNGTASVLDGVEILEQDEAVDFIDHRRNFCGIMEDIYSADIDGYNDYENTAYIYGEAVSAVRQEETIGGAEVMGVTYSYLADFYVKPEKILSGFPEHFQEENPIRVVFYSNGEEEIKELGRQIEAGEKYIFKLKLNPDITINNEKVMGFILEEEAGIYAYPSESGDIKAALPKDVLEAVAVNEANIHSVQMVTTKDMSMMPSVQQKYYIDSGRTLTRDDDLNGAKVCVVRRELAELRNLKIGDSLKVKIINDENVYVQNAEMLQKETVTEEYKIVGTYGILDNTSEITTFTHSQIFVPDSSVPETWEQTPYSSTTTFVLKAPELMEEFQGFGMTKLRERGYTVVFLENGWEKFNSTITPLKRAALTGVIIFGFVYILLLGIVMSYIVYTNRKSWKILRLLGTEPHDVSRWFTAVYFCTGALVTGISAAAAWKYGTAKGREALSALENADTGYLAESRWYILLIFAAAMAAILYIAIILSARILNKGNLLSQPNEALGKNFAKKADDVYKTDADSQSAAWPLKKDAEPAVLKETAVKYQNAKPAERIKRAVYCRYTYRHLYRAWKQNVCIVLMTAVFILGIGFFRWNIQENENKMNTLYSEVTVSGNVVMEDANVYIENDAFISANIADYLKNSEFIENTVTEAGFLAYIISEDFADGNETEYRAKAIESEEAYTPLKDGRMQIEYAPGYDASVFSESYDEESAKIIVSEEILNNMGLQLGDHVFINFRSGGSEWKGQMGVIAGALVPLDYAETDTKVLMPIGQLAEAVGHDNLVYSKAEFTIDPSKNQYLDMFKKEADEIMRQPQNQIPVKSKIVVKDDELEHSVRPLEKTVSVLKLLYPVIMIILMAASAGMMVLFIFGAVSETVILRLVGTPAAGAAMMLWLEKMTACLLGICIGGAAAAALPYGGSFDAVKDVLPAGLLIVFSEALAAGTASVHIIKKRLLILLSQKE